MKVFWIILIALLLICENILLYSKTDAIVYYVDHFKEIAKEKGFWGAIIDSFKWVKRVINRIIGVVSGNSQDDLIPIKKEGKNVTIAFRPTGGLGDYIISAKLLEELLSLGNINICVFVEKMAFGQAIYANRDNVKIKDYEFFEQDLKRYDLALEVDHFVNVKHYDSERVRELCPTLADSIDYIIKNADHLFVKIREQFGRERVQFERCKLLGLDRWTELRMGKAFKIENKDVYIPLLEDCKNDLQARFDLNSKYITVNFGADKMREGQDQLKMWPKNHFEEFIALFKAKHSDIRVVQLGAKDATKLEGCDEYIFGETLEYTKWILKSSMCHIDCEGGLVHLARQFGTKCVVLFGPTPVNMYGYEENINILAGECSNCMALQADWAYSCFAQSGCECMRNITPDRVIKSVEDIINMLTII